MRRIAVAIGAVAVLAAGATAFAQTTGDERIYACVNNGDGTVRQVAGPDVACSKGWHKLSWSANQNAVPKTTTYAVHQPGTVDPGTTTTLTANCNDGDIATGGGYQALPDAVHIARNEPDIEGGLPIAWRVSAFNSSGFTQTINATAVCQHTE